MAHSDEPRFAIVEAIILDGQVRASEDPGRIHQIKAPFCQNLGALGRIASDPQFMLLQIMKFEKRWGETPPYDCQRYLLSPPLTLGTSPAANP